VRVVALVALLTLVATSACSGGRDAPEPPVAEASGTGAPCVPAATPAASPAGTAGAAIQSAGTAGASGGEKVPDVALACFVGGAQTRLRTLGRPAVINLWGSWCPPCRRELPALNTYARRGTVLVLGVVTADTRSAAGSIVDEFGLGFPNLYDREGKLHKAIGSLPLPITLFVAADGTVAYTHRAGALDEAGFERLAHEHLGVS
jgi:thiol-disulfide isomerase/thioredoxin